MLRWLAPLAEGEQIFKGSAGPPFGVGIIHELMSMFEGHANADDLISKLDGIEVGAQVLLFYGGLGYPGNGLGPVPLRFHQQIADRARPVTVFRRKRHEDASAFKLPSAHPAHIAIK